MKLVHRHSRLALVFVLAVCLTAPAGVSAAAPLNSLRPVLAQMPASPNPGTADSVSWTNAIWYEYD